MANDRNDFAPEVRNGAWWSGDSRLAANGRGNDAVLQKLGLMERPDLSQVEAVQMGHVMQPLIGRLAQDKLGIELKDADYALTHPKETWLRSHFDFISSDGKTLVEAKNYNAGVRNKFDSEANIVPAADMAQLVHEATVHNVDRIVLAVLFGGQEFQTFDFTITPEQKTQLIEDMAIFWAAVVAQNPMEPETTSQAKLMYAKDNGTYLVGTQSVERVATALKHIKTQIKALEKQEEEMTVALQGFMKEYSELVTIDGTVLATWRNSKASKKFSLDLFKSAMPDIYEQFLVETPGSRRFLVK